MDTICFSRDAKLLKIQPGDATVYTLFVDYDYGDENDAPFLAIGAGNVIEGGYPVPLDNLVAFWDDMLDILKSASHAENRFQEYVAIDHLMDHEFVSYWRGHANIKNRWTAIVALLAFFIIRAEPENLWPKYITAIANIYYCQWEEALTILGMPEEYQE